MNMHDPLLPPPDPSERPADLPAPRPRSTAGRTAPNGEDRAARIAAARASMNARRGLDDAAGDDTAGTSGRRPAPRPTARTSQRRKHPAVSARVLAVGLSTMAVLGLTTGYSVAEKAQKEKKLDEANNVVVDPAAQPAAPVVDPAATPQAQQPAQQQPTQQPSQPSQQVQRPRQPQQVQIPVPAQPAPVGGNNQNTSGSN